MENYPVITKKEILPFMYLKGFNYARWNNSDEDKYCMISLIYEIQNQKN